MRTVMCAGTGKEIVDNVRENSVFLASLHKQSRVFEKRGGAIQNK